MQQGITFEVAGSDGERRDRPFPLDLVPRVLTAAEWTTIKRGLAQRIRALNAFVDDVYHAHEIVRAGIVPWSLVVSRPSFARPVHGVRPPGGVYCHVSGCDLVRDGDGPLARARGQRPHPVGDLLRAREPAGDDPPDPRAVRRPPRARRRALPLAAARGAAGRRARRRGPSDGRSCGRPDRSIPAYFEHAFLARQMGVELVEASDLVVRDAVCYIRTTAGLQRVHAIYRRLDDDFIDPLEFRPDSLLGVPGLVRAYRSGTVAIANAVGTGVADDKAIYHYVPEMIRFYLGEEPILENVPTYLLTDDAVRKEVLRRLHELVVKPTSESGGKGVFIGPLASAAELEQEARLIASEPQRFIAQELVHLSTAPTEVGDGRLAPRHVDLRPFAVFGDEIRIVPGGLTRVALREGSMIVNSSQGGGSKDTWVLDDGSVGADLAPGTLPARRPPRLPDVRYGGWHGQAQQQQQERSSFRESPRLMLARIAQELFWLGRDLTRAEHTARMLDGAFHADVAGVPGERGIALSWEGVLAIIGAKPPVPGEPAADGPSLSRAAAAELSTVTGAAAKWPAC